MFLFSVFLNLSHAMVVLGNWSRISDRYLKWNSEVKKWRLNGMSATRKPVICSASFKSQKALATRCRSDESLLLVN